MEELTVTESAVLDEFVAKESQGPASIPIKIISPGWGSMAYYSADMIKSSGPSCFTKGTHMMWNHATDAQEAARPEGDLDSLAAVLTKDAHWEDNGPKGPGLYSEAKVFSDYAQKVAEKGPHIGISINAAIAAERGEVEGRKGLIAKEFRKAFSTDFVTKAGAGGAPIVPVVESAGATPPISIKEKDMEKEALEALQNERDALKAQVTALKASADKGIAKEAVREALGKSNVKVSESLLDRLCENPIVTEGKADTKWVDGVVALFPVSDGQGRVDGMGAPVAKTTGTDEFNKRMREALKTLGIPEGGLDIAVRGR